MWWLVATCGFIIGYWLWLHLKVHTLMDSDYIYNQSWEDPRVDEALYDLRSGSRICMITTGGDNVLDYLLHDPESIDAVDSNPRQNWLLELKMACVRTLHHAECFALLAQGDASVASRRYPEIRAHLSGPACAFWDTNTHRIHHILSTGWVSWFASVFRVVARVFGLMPVLERVLALGGGLDVQRRLLEPMRPRLKCLGRCLHGLATILTPFVGVPPAQLALNTAPTTVADMLEHIGFHTDLVRDNYFYYPYLFGGFWTPECCPRYLQAKHFETVKSRLDRIRIHTDTMENVARATVSKSYTHFILLDHLDWMSEQLITREWGAIEQAAAPDALVCFRSFAPVMPFMYPRRHECVHSAPIMSSDVPVDRVGSYYSAHVFRLKRDGDKYLATTTPTYPLTTNQKLQTFLTMMVSPLSTSSTHTAFLERFYASQATTYDAYRQNMLHGKRELAHALPWRKGTSVLLFAGGTGDLLDYVGADGVAQLGAVTIMDLCDSLLDVARARVARHGWTNVEVVRADACMFVRPRQYDVVICTYALSMIPDWRRALDNAAQSCKVGGLLCIADFTVPTTFTRYFWRTVFALDHVNLDPVILEHVHKLVGNVLYHRQLVGTFPLLPSFLFTCPYYVHITECT
jgi:S-adenosylmethionine:diacylglycerol 3-amino-3-carboxypropyl transferase/ubiquinone/menaquinone biosynthesis C-methylase UbiE